MKYSIHFYCYKLEDNELSISISKKYGLYLLTKTYKIYSLESSFPKYVKRVSFINYMDMLKDLMTSFDTFYKKNISHAFSVEQMPPNWFITDICDLFVDEYIKLKNSASIEMVYLKFLYNYKIINDIKSKLNKALFRLLTIKIGRENIESLRALCIASDIIVQFI
jgi:hypothetical protein